MTESIEESLAASVIHNEKTDLVKPESAVDDFLEELSGDSPAQTDDLSAVTASPDELRAAPPQKSAASEQDHNEDKDVPSLDAQTAPLPITKTQTEDTDNEFEEADTQPAAEIPASVVASSGSQKTPGVYKSSTLVTNTGLTNAVASGMVSKKSLIALGMDHLNRGAQNTYAAQKDASELRKNYEKAARRHRNAKWSMLAAEAGIMGVFSYDMIEDWTGLSGTTEAIATNTALTGGVAGLRAYVQYEMMKRGEDSLKKGKKIQGYMFSAIGLAIAAANAIFVAHGFGKRSIEQTQEIALVELDQISGQQAEIFSEKTIAQDGINASIDALDQKILEIQSGARDPSIAALDEEMQRLKQEIQDMNNHESFNDGKVTEQDRIIRKEIARNSAELNSLSTRKAELLSNVGTNMKPEVQRMFEATTNQRLDLDQQIQNLDERYKPQMDALQASRNVWEAKLTSATSGGDDVFKAMYNNPVTLLEGVVMGAGISIANWAAAHQGQKQEEFEHILSGEPEDPWAAQKKESAVDDLLSPSFNASSQPVQVFMGHSFSKDRSEHLRNEAHVNALAQALKNPEAMRIELCSEISRQHGKMVAVLNQQFAQLPEDLYVQRLNTINAAYQDALEAVEGHDVIAQLEDLISSADIDIPTFTDPDDPELMALPTGAQFKTPDGALRLKA
jgi:hypothetical protein|tara:strand:- start:81949 stop:83976 length:2028 start_codon:yes stop_codon:yes gene_type:complete